MVYDHEQQIHIQIIALLVYIYRQYTYIVWKYQFICTSFRNRKASLWRAFLACFVASAK